jgi:hypothetical protein
VARHRSPRGRHAHRALPFPPVGTTEGAPGARASLVPPAVAPVVRAPATRGVAVRGIGVAAVAAAAVSGATVTVTSPPPAQPASDPIAPSRTAVASLMVPTPGSVVLPTPVGPVTSDAAGRETTVLDAAGLSDAVARAQGEARRLAEEARNRVDADHSTRQRAEEAAQEAEDQAAEQAEEDRRTAERAARVGRLGRPEPSRPPAATGAPDCGLDTGRLGPVQPHVRTAAEILGCAFGKPTVLGIAGRGGPSDHPKGRALDFLVDRPTGDALAACAVRNREALGVSYVIWRQRIDTGGGFRPMEDRGSPTANHFDHVHVSFDPSAGTGGAVNC